MTITFFQKDHFNKRPLHEAGQKQQQHLQKLCWDSTIIRIITIILETYQENNRMSLVVGLHAAFHHQYFKMVDVLIHYFEMSTKKLNPCAKPCEPKCELEEVIATEKAQQKDKRAMKIIEGYDFGWKFHVKY